MKKEGRVNIYELSAESPSPGFGYSASGSDTQAQC